jgi:GNAT superfamily N-acetyltransferase
MESGFDATSRSCTQITAAMEQNMVGHMSYAAERLAGATVLKGDGLTLVDAGVSTDTFNVICGAALGARTADAAISAAIAWFQAKGQPFSWWVGSASMPQDLGARLVAHGLVHAETETGMVLDLGRLNDREIPISGVDIRRATDRMELHDIATIVAANWDPPDKEVITYYHRTAGILLGPASPFRFWVAYLSGQPAAACESFLGAGVAGIYAVVTRAAYRRRGIGTAVVRAALLNARAEGYRVATLQASEQGQRIYERLGFTTCGSFREYKPAGIGSVTR